MAPRISVVWRSDIVSVRSTLTGLKASVMRFHVVRVEFSMNHKLRACWVYTECKFSTIHPFPTSVRTGCMRTSSVETGQLQKTWNTCPVRQACPFSEGESQSPRSGKADWPDGIQTLWPHSRGDCNCGREGIKIITIRHPHLIVIANITNVRWNR